MSPCYFIGLRRAQEGDGFLWADGSSFVGFPEGIDSGPYFGSGDKDCACVLKLQGVTTRAISMDCSKEQRFICARQGILELQLGYTKPISVRVDRASAAETIDLGSIPNRVKPKTVKIGIHRFPA